MYLYYTGSGGISLTATPLQSTAPGRTSRMGVCRQCDDLDFALTDASGAYTVHMYILQEQTMQTRIKKWGNSLAVRIPQTLARQLGLEPDSLVNMTAEEKGLTIQPMRRPPASLDALLDCERIICTGSRHWPFNRA